MADVLTPEQRRLNMSRIKGRNTKPERLVRCALHARGFRFRLHQDRLPGRPDIVLSRYQTVIMVHGCFWHGHGCRLCKMPSTRREFWMEKIRRNHERDIAVTKDLEKLGWKVIVVWECAIRGRAANHIENVFGRISALILGKRRRILEVSA
jgi:DNA mismatch endonuclease (patch repair protein)